MIAPAGSALTAVESAIFGAYHRTVRRGVGLGPLMLAREANVGANAARAAYRRLVTLGLIPPGYQPGSKAALPFDAAYRPADLARQRRYRVVAGDPEEGLPDPPTREEIEMACQEIRSTWSRYRYRRAWGADGPLVSVSRDWS